MIYCRKCNAVNPPEAITCEKCADPLLPQPTIGERLKKNLVFVILFVLGILTATYLYVTFGDEKYAGSTVCLSFIVVVSFVVILIALVRKYPPWELYKQRALRHLKIDPEQAKKDFLKAYLLIPAAKRFQGFLSFFTSYHQLDADKSELALINLIRIVPPAERQSMGNNYPKTMFNLDQELESDAKTSEVTGDFKRAARKHLYFSYFVESQFGKMFKVKQTTDAFEAMVDGAKQGFRQSKLTSSISEIRKDAVTGRFATTILACQICKQIVTEEHDPKHKRKIYPIYLIPNEIRSVQQAFLERYPQVKK